MMGLGDRNLQVCRVVLAVVLCLVAHIEYAWVPNKSHVVILFTCLMHLGSC